MLRYIPVGFDSLMYFTLKLQIVSRKVLPTGLWLKKFLQGDSSEVNFTSLKTTGCMASFRYVQHFSNQRNILLQDTL